VVEAVIAARLADLDPTELRRLADVVTRLLVSYAVAAPDDDPRLVASYVATFLTHGALGAPLTGGAPR
jgi:hypothetical protein